MDDVVRLGEPAGGMSQAVDGTPVDRLLAVAARLSAVVLVLLLALGFTTGDGGALLAIVAVTAVLAFLIARAETGAHRRRILELTVIGAALRGLALVAATRLQAAGDTIVLGPDGQRFLASALTILEGGLVPSESTFSALGTFDVGHMFVFAGLIAAFGRSLLVLQTFNCAVATLLAPLTYGWVRRAAPAVALPAALLVVAYPSIVYLAAVDIWKDPLVITATTAAIWGLARLVHDRLDAGGLLVCVLVTGASAAFVHVSRFYPLWYLELGLAGMAGLHLLRRATPNWRAVVPIVAVVLLAEGLPAVAGWPLSPRAFAAGIAQASSATSMNRFTAGLLDRLGGNALPPDERGTAYRVRRLDQYGLGAFGGRGALQVDIDTRSADPSRFGLLGRAVQLVRRIWGPFIWVAPPSLAARDLLSGDYLLYPGMVFWYVLLPFMAAGLVLSGVELLRGRLSFVLGVIWIYAVAYSGQFLVINLPYRQREAMFPVLVVFALLGAAALWRHAWTRRVYVMYWIGLAMVAAAHTVVRFGQPQAG